MNRRSFLGVTATLFTGPDIVSRLTLLPVSEVRSAPALRLFVNRSLADAKCMRGFLLTQVEGETKPAVACYVLELPPGGNAPYVSAIPAGTYTVHVRVDGKLGWRLELKDVPGRDDVQIHLGNYPSNTLGCLLPGLGTLPTECAVSKSAEAMAQLRVLFAAFGENGETTLTIRDAG